MSTDETYQWAKKQSGIWDKLEEKIPRSDLHNFGALQFVRFENLSFKGEVAPAGADLIFHFFPTAHDGYNKLVRANGEGVWVFGETFADHLAEAFLATFKHPERLFWDFVPEMNSWVVRVQGYSSNPFFMELIEGVLCRLKELHER